MFQGRDQAPDLKYTKSKVKLQSLKQQKVKGLKRLTLQRHKGQAIREAEAYQDKKTTNLKKQPFNVFLF